MNVPERHGRLSCLAADLGFSPVPSVASIRANSSLIGALRVIAIRSKQIDSGNFNLPLESAKIGVGRQKFDARFDGAPLHGYEQPMLKLEQAANRHRAKRDAAAFQNDAPYM
jgi:hypothetical protein